MQMKINLDEVQRANSRLLPAVDRLDYVNHNLSILEWRLPEELLAGEDFCTLFESTVTDIDELHSQLSDMCSVVESIVSG